MLIKKVSEEPVFVLAYLLNSRVHSLKMLTLKIHEFVTALTEVDDSYMIPPITGHFFITELVTEAYHICHSEQSL